MTKQAEMWPGMTVRYFNALKPYIRGLADELELRDWVIDLQHQPVLNDDDAAAQIKPIYGRKRAKLWLCRDFADSERHEQRHYLVHELVHCHIDAVDTVLQNGLDEVLGKPAHVILLANSAAAIEHATDALASALARHLPLPPT